MKPLHVQCNGFGQADDAHLGRAVIGLPKVADQAGGRCHVNIGTRFLAFEMRRSGPRHVEAAFKVNIDHGIKVILRHLVKNHVAQIAGIVDHAIDLAEQIERLNDDGLG